MSKAPQPTASASICWVSMLDGDFLVADGCPSSTNKLEIPSPAEITSWVERESTPSRQNIEGAIQELKTTVISLSINNCYFSLSTS
uniref:Uncharacterized protein n=1 Tax=Aegilops tauschii subsp. strangulata TaxID=200361 RepID=A0A453BUE5_AEGTS